MKAFQIHRAMRQMLDRGVSTEVATKQCVNKLIEHGHLLPKGHQGPIKVH